MNEDDQEYVEENLEAEDNDGKDNDGNELLTRVKRIEKGVGEIYKLLKAGNTQAVKTDKACPEHGDIMSSAISKKTNKPYGFHRNEQGQICFGRGYQS